MARFSFDLKGLGIKIGAVIIALFLWFHVVTERTYEDEIHVPVKLEGISEGLVLATEVPQEVTVRVVGKGKRLLTLRMSHPQVRLNLNQVLRKKVFRLRAGDVGVSPDNNVRVVGIEPKRLVVELDRLISRKVTVTPALKIIPAEGYVQIGSERLVPESVTLSGPGRFITPVSTLTTDSLIIEGAKKGVKERLGVLLPKGVNVNCTPPSVTIHVDIQKLGEREIGGIPVKLVHAPREIRVSPDTVSVTVAGGTKYLATLGPKDFSAWVDYRSRKSPSKLAVFVDLPPEVKLQHVHPDSVRVIRPR